MAYRCLDCGHIFDDGEQAFWLEDGEYWGDHFSKKMSGCPICKGAYKETVRCQVCGSEHLENELTEGVCEDCIDEYRKDFDGCYNLSIGEKTEVKINSVLAFLFDDADIEQILKQYIHEKWQDVDCSPFIDENKEWFAEKILEEVRKNEQTKGQSQRGKGNHFYCHRDKGRKESNPRNG